MSVKGWYPIGPSCLFNGQLADSMGAPVSGRVTCIVIHPTDPKIVYLGTASGGVWKTINSGADWTPIMDDQISLSVGAMALDHENLDRLYVATGEGNSAGESLTSRGVLIYNPLPNPTWTLRGYDDLKGTGIRRIIIDPRTSGATKRILLATDRGLLESLDDGLNWGKMDVLNNASPSVEIADIVLAPGATAAQDVLLAAIMGKTVYRKVGTGAWELNPPNISAEAKRNRITLALCRDHPERVYALFADSDGLILGMYKSDDTGKTWTADPTKPSGSDMRQGEYNLALAVHPVNKDIVFLAEVRLWRSADGGDSWDNVSDPLADSPGIHADQHAVAISPSSPGVVWSGNDGGAWISENGGLSFRSRNRGLQTMQFYSLAQHPDDASLALAGAQDNGTSRYEGSGAWDLSGYGDGFFCAIDPVDKFRWYSSYCFMSDGKVKAILRSEKAGAPNSWSYITDNIDNSFENDDGTKPAKHPPFYVPFIIDPNDHTRLYLGTNKLWRSDHFGDDWQAVLLQGTTTPFTTGPKADNTITAIAVAPGDSRLVWVGTRDGRLFQLDQKNGLEYDVTELTAAPPATEWVTGFYISDIAVTKALDPMSRPAMNNIYVALGSRHVSWVKGDGPAPLGRMFVCSYDPLALRSKFQALSNMPFRTLNGKVIDTKENPVNAIVIDPDHDNQIFIGCDSGIYRTNNSGGIWEDYTANLPNVAIGDLQFHKPSRLLRAATMGRSVWERQVDVVDPAAPVVDLFIRDNVIDLGLAPAAASLEDPYNPGGNVTAFSGADIKIDTPWLGIGSFQDIVSTEDYTAATGPDYVAFQSISCDEIRRKVKSRYFVEVMNRGPQPVTEAVVRAFIVPKDINGYGQLPTNFWTNFLTGGDNDFGLWKSLGGKKDLNIILPGNPKVAMWEFEIPVDMPDTVGVLAISSCKEDPVGTPDSDVDVLATANKRVALREVPVNMRADAVIGITLALIGLAAVGTVVGLKAGNVI